MTTSYLEPSTTEPTPVFEPLARGTVYELRVSGFGTEMNISTPLCSKESSSKQSKPDTHVFSLHVHLHKSATGYKP